MFKKYGHKQITVFLHGGEPLLATMEFFYNLEKLLLKYGKGFDIARKIQTNLFVLSQESIELFKNYEYTVFVSLDGSERLNNLRLDKFGNATYKRVLSNLKKLINNNISVKIMVAIGKHNHKKTKQIISFFNKRNLQFFINFLKGSKYDLSKKEKQKFINNLLKDYKRNKNFNNQFLDVIANNNLNRCSFYNTCFKTFPTCVVDFNGNGYLCNKFLSFTQIPMDSIFNINNNKDLDSQIKQSQLFKTFLKIKVKNNCSNCSVLPFFCGGLNCPYDLIVKLRRLNKMCFMR